jgi:hypothetical protein
VISPGQTTRKLVAALGILAAACGHGRTAPALEKRSDEDIGVPDVPVPPENGPRLGALANVTPIFDRPSKRGTLLGALHAGATVPRASEPFGTVGCDGGWFAVRPRGFACAGAAATTDLAHPTLVAMGIQPDRAGTLPYTYARAVRDTTLFEADAAHDTVVRPKETLRAKSGLAVVGSWSAADPSGKPLHLAMTTDGHFVPAEDLESAAPSSFHGVELGNGAKLPVAFVVKRGVHSWKLEGDEPEKRTPLDYHARIELTGRTRTLSGVEFWAAPDGSAVRLADVTLVRERHEFPDFATGEQKWIDVSVVTGTLVMYEGRKPVFATLVSVGRDRLGAPESTATTTRGEHSITAKHVTFAGRDPNTFADGIAIYDAPWAIELSSGQLLVGAYWHDRFGIEHGPGNLELSPADAARVFRWTEPALPDGWHAVNAAAHGDKSVVVNVRK